MAYGLSGHDFQVEDQTTHYLESGPQDGPLLIFLHGWPDLALIWKHQLRAFASLGFHVVAPDTRGYGKSSAPKDKHAYRLEQLVKEQVALLKHLGHDKAIWIGHDWGCGILSALAAHHPEVLHGAVWLAVPYRTVDRGFDHLMTLVNRERYPVDEYPYGPWEYMKAYEENPNATDEHYGPIPEKVLKLLYIKSNPSKWGQPSPTSRTLREGGLFRGTAENIADMPLEAAIPDEELFKEMVDSRKRNGWYPATAYYLNHDVNAKFDGSRVNDGILEVPCLFIDAKYDAVCSATTAPKMVEGMRQACKNLTEAWVEAGHWLQIERPVEVNAVLAKWLTDELPQFWPYVKKVKMHKV